MKPTFPHREAAKPDQQRPRGPKRTRASRRFGPLVVLAAIIGVCVPVAGLGATPESDGNPDLPQKCGLDMTIVIDRSGSIGGSNTDVAAAANSLIGGLANTGSRVQLVSFSDLATIDTYGGQVAGPTGGVSGIGSLQLLPAESVTVPEYNSAGGTNWDDALEVVRRAPSRTPLTVVLTDGNPNLSMLVTPDGHGGIWMNGGNLAKAVAEADLIKAQGSHILAVGIGTDINEANLQAISGGEELTGDNGIGIAQADWTTVGFGELRALLSNYAKEMCSPSVNITKTEIPLEGAERPGDGWSFTVDLDAAPTEWQNPTQAASVRAATQSTVDGKANFKWEQGTAGVGASITEAAQPGWQLDAVTCLRRNYDTGVTTELSLAPRTNADGSVTWAVPDGLSPADSINCEVRNREVVPATIDVRKFTNPAGTEGRFGFALAGGGIDRSLDGIGHGETKSFGEVNPGTYVLSETPVEGFALASAGCDNLGTEPAESADPKSLVVGDGEHWLCTFTNDVSEGTDSGADLSIVKSVDKPEADSGDELTYTLTVANAGPDAATEVVVTDELPSELTIVSVDGDEDHDWDCDASTDELVSCALARLEPDDETTITVVATLKSDPGTVTNTAVVDSESPDPDDSNNTDSADVVVPAVEVAEATTTTIPAVVGGITATQPRTEAIQTPLAFTGASVLSALLLGLVVVSVGAMFVAINRRRNAGQAH